MYFHSWEYFIRYFFYITKKKYQKEKNNLFDFDYHPFNITLIYAILPLFIFGYKYLRKQIKLIGKNLTTKQYMSIKEERNKNKQNTKIFYYLDSILRKKIDYKNIFKFFFTKQTPSPIYNFQKYFFYFINLISMSKRYIILNEE